MATKPNETYKWGENATHEQVAAYDDTGWPSDIIPPKRTQFNWYQNLVGKWLGWAEEAVDELVSTVLERWFTVVYSSGGANWEQTIPNENGLYEYRAGVPSLHLERWLVTVTNGTAVAVRLRTTTAGNPTHFELALGVWDDGLSAWVREYTFNRANSRSDILNESPVRYVTPRGLVDYFRVGGAGGPYLISQLDDGQGIYPAGRQAVVQGATVVVPIGFSIVLGDECWEVSVNDDFASKRYKYELGVWVETPFPVIQ